jgi:hypothetical protein
MGDTTKTKAAMLNELESIKGLLLAADDIPILQEEVFEASAAASTKTRFEEQQDFFHAHSHSHLNQHPESHKTSSAERPQLAKAMGENPFLPEHIRARLHGNNPPPLFAAETAHKIAHSSSPSRQLGNTFSAASSARAQHQQQDIIDSIIAKLLPEIEQELRARLEQMSKHLLDELQR